MDQSIGSQGTRSLVGVRGPWVSVFGLPINMLGQVSIWPCLMFFKLKIPKILKSVRGNWKTVGCNGNRTFFKAIGRCVACVELLAY